MFVIVSIKALNKYLYNVLTETLKILASAHNKLQITAVNSLNNQNAEHHLNNIEIVFEDDDGDEIQNSSITNMQRFEWVPVSVINQTPNQDSSELSEPIFIATEVVRSPVDSNHQGTETQINSAKKKEPSKRKWARKVRPRDEDMPPKVLTRKRQVNKNTWIKNRRKRLRQSGKEYLSAVKEEKCPEKTYRYRNCTLCKFKCNKFVSREQAENIFKEFWDMEDNDKSHFYDKTTKRLPKERTRPENAESARPRTYSFQYFFVINEDKKRVCKAFYLGVLAVSQRRISYFHEKKKCGVTQTPTKDKRGTKTKKRIPEEDRQHIRDHINAFPRVEGHYCRKDTKKDYFEQGLNLSKLYELYVEWCQEKKYNVQKKWLYDNIFNNEFNIGFFIPKKDQCDICQEHMTKLAQNFVLRQQEVNVFETHMKEKEYARNEKQNDRDSKSEHRVVVCFDMQRVLTCPQSSISVFYYSRKFSVFNLTGYDLNQRQGYCMLWHEGVSGRDGNDIASATVRLLEKILASYDNPVEELILWSDACVPQNKNSFMATALIELLNQSNHLKIIHQKFQEPGHSCVQEVDSVHSVIDRHLERLEVHSPLAMVRTLLKVRSKKKLRVYQMRKACFKDYKSVAKTFTTLDQVPFSKIKHIVYTKDSNLVKYKTSFDEEDFKEVNFKTSRSNTRRTTKLAKTELIAVTPKASVNRKTITIPSLKKEDIKKLYKFFSEDDKMFWDSILNNN